MSLSILIPCYNWDVYQLIKDLQKQCIEEYSIDNFEILCIEDGSKNYFQNNKIDMIEGVRYEIRTKNIGRSAIRNLLSKKARFSWLLFIDCDSKIVTKNFIESYKKNIGTNEKTVFYGKTTYPKNTLNKKTILHEKYGRIIESKRKKDFFSSHHFLIHKNCFQEIRFDEKIKSYGYEDVLFQIESDYSFQYIDNTLCHIGLKSNEKFLQDCEESLRNITKYIDNKNIINQIKILRYWQTLSRCYLDKIISVLFNIFQATIKRNLLSKNPNLTLLQIYKMGFLIKEIKRLPSS